MRHRSSNIHNVHNVHFLSNRPEREGLRGTMARRGSPLLPTINPRSLQIEQKGPPYPASTVSHLKTSLRVIPKSRASSWTRRLNKLFSLKPRPEFPSFSVANPRLRTCSPAARAEMFPTSPYSLSTKVAVVASSPIVKYVPA